MSFTLDCTTGEKALFSLSEGFDCTISKLKNTLLSLDLDTLYAQGGSNITVPPETYLYQYAVAKLGTHVPLAKTVWLHCTRTHSDEQFSDGILPLNQAVDRVWQMVLSLAPDSKVRDRLIAWGSHSVPDRLYQLRTKNSEHWGPYGFLVKEVALHAEDLGQHDYLKMPELIEDICNAYQKEFGESIFRHYFTILTPKMVAFISDKGCSDNSIKAALGYAYTTVRGLPPDWLAVTCIDCRGIVISPSQIIHVESL